MGEKSQEKGCIWVANFLMMAQLSPIAWGSYLLIANLPSKPIQIFSWEFMGDSVHQSSSHSNWASPLLWGAIWIGAQVLWRKTGLVAQQRQTCTWKARINLNEESIFHTFPTSASRESFIDFSKPSKMIWYSKGLNELRHVILGCQIYVPDLEYATTYYFRLLGRAARSCPGVSTYVSCHWSPELPNISASL